MYGNTNEYLSPGIVLTVTEEVHVRNMFKTVIIFAALFCATGGREIKSVAVNPIFFFLSEHTTERLEG